MAKLFLERDQHLRPDLTLQVCHLQYHRMRQAAGDFGRRPVQALRWVAVRPSIGAHCRGAHARHQDSWPAHAQLAAVSVKIKIRKMKQHC